MRPPEVQKGEREADRQLESLHFKGDRDYVDRIPSEYGVEMALPSPRPQAGWKKARRREKREERREHMAAS